MHRGRARLLLAEDDPVVARTYRMKLEHDGFDVRVAGDGEAAFRHACEDPPDLLLFDLDLTAADRLAMLGRLRDHEATRRVPVLVLSTLPGPGRVPATLSARVTAILDDVQPGWRQRAWTSEGHPLAAEDV